MIATEYINDAEAQIIFEDMPGSIKAFVKRVDGTNCIIVNSNLNDFAQYKPVMHEIDHILNGDIDSQLNVMLIERQK